MSVEDLAKKLGYNRQHLRWMAANGKIPAMKRIRKWVFDPQEIERFFQQKTAEATQR
jgi:hypothetical protein